MVLNTRAEVESNIENLLSKTSPIMPQFSLQPHVISIWNKDLSGISVPMINVPLSDPLARFKCKVARPEKVIHA